LDFRKGIGRCFIKADHGSHEMEGIVGGKQASAGICRRCRTDEIAGPVTFRRDG
jgi:hypothetical protein